jgi:hypothetical protein
MSTSTSLKNHLKVLEKKHRDLDEKIIILEDEHFSNEMISPFKLEKLRLKREIEKLQQQITLKEEQEQHGH